MNSFKLLHLIQVITLILQLILFALILTGCKVNLSDFSFGEMSGELDFRR